MCIYGRSLYLCAQKEQLRYTMKKIFVFACAAVLGFAACTKDLENRVGALENDVESIQQQLTELSDKLNNEVDNLKKLIDALKENVFVTGVSEIKEDGKVVGYTITLSKGKALTIYHGTNGKDGSNGLDGTNGKDAVSPTVGVIVVDGVYYWAVNGVALTDAAGNMIPVYAETDAPEFKYEDGKWWISTDGTWSPLVSAGTGESVFADVQYNDSSVTFVLANGTEIVLPRQAAFSLNIDGNVTVIPGATVNVAYTITGATENTTVYAIADAGYSVKVEAASVSEGNLVIKTPNPLTDGKVVVFAGNNTNAGMATISFTEGVVTIAENKYTVAKDGGNIEIPVTTNYSYEVVIPENASWLTYVETKAMRDETVVLNAAANVGTSRSATVTIKSGDKTWCTFEVAQEGSVAANLTAEDLIGTWTVSYISKANAELSFDMPITASDDASKGNLILTKWFNWDKRLQDETIYATFDANAMTLSIASDQKIKGSYNDPGKAKDKDGNWLDPIVFTVSGDGKTLSIDSKVQFGTYYMSQFTSYGDNYSLTKQE